MRNMVVGLLLAALCSGCAAHRVGVPPGEAFLLGSVAVERSLIQSGGASGAELVVSAGRYGGVVISIDKGRRDELALYLPRGGIEAYAGHLQTLVEWGETARQEKIDTIKSVGSFTCQAESGNGPAVIGTRFISSRGGQSWLGQARFCRLQEPAGRSSEAETSAGGNSCEREASFYLRPAAIHALLEILGQRLASTGR